MELDASGLEGLSPILQMMKKTPRTRRTEKPIHRSRCSCLYTSQSRDRPAPQERLESLESSSSFVVQDYAQTNVEGDLASEDLLQYEWQHGSLLHTVDPSTRPRLSFHSLNG